MSTPQTISGPSFDNVVVKKVYNATGSTITAKTPGYLAMGTYGMQFLALTDDTKVHYFCVAYQDIPAAKWGFVVTEGECQCTVTSASYTTGHAFKVHNGAVATMGAAPDTSGLVGEATNDLGVIKTGGTDVTEITLCLSGKPATQAHS